MRKRQESISDTSLRRDRGLRGNPQAQVMFRPHITWIEVDPVSD
jgi:hypothetical protein